ncbi:uncharacterized protein BX663DRAFT_552660 [Cokeromyces recurvatus]|uniref:uncharacterized protein n=1 Tax=Cokeromyces recurvatus TaxID=90255 RepID=UPI00221E9607|nr:uncharacterized protein BX663DRAFT_552660 [Cokeromyces recurvatus]KAI7902244.1 hypothetical protein BX663DRAFT_552660 [Cokeromyces recurvatus]
MEEKLVTVALQEQVLQSINSNVPFIPGQKLSKVKPHLSALETFVTSVKSRIADGTFTPEKKNRRINVATGFSLYYRSIHLKQKVSIEKQPADFLEDIENGYTSGRQRTSSLDEYYHLCGYNDATFTRNQHQKQLMAEYLKISDLSSLKTSNIKDFIKACKERQALYDDIKKKQKGVHEICKRFDYNSSKYHQKSSTGVKSVINNVSEFYPPTPADHKERPVKTIITLGDGVV